MQAVTRSEVKEKDRWDLSSLFEGDAAFQKALGDLQAYAEEAPAWKGKIGEGKSSFLSFLAWYEKVLILAERVGCYAMLHYSADASDPLALSQYGKASQILTSLQAALAYVDPEILALPEETYKAYLSDPDFKDMRIWLEKSRRFKPHVLSEKEERVLAMFSDAAQTPDLAFSDLTNVDFDFGTVDGKPLTQSTYNSFMQSHERAIRKAAYDRLYGTFEAHQHVLARLYEGSVKQDCAEAALRGYPSARAKALFPDNIPESVYTSLISAVHEGFPALHRFYEVKRRVLGLDRLAHWDVYVPLVEGVEHHTSYEDAVATVTEAVKPLGDDYAETLKKGLTEWRWADRYENRGKRSGAFSSGVYTSSPFILLNFQGDSLNDLFTMVHEGGHSMHSYYSKKNNPFWCYDYTIFEAETASTTNEQLLSRYLIGRAKDGKTKAYLIGKQLDDIVATLFRQTMFAEYEDACHSAFESGTPLSVDFLRKTYRDLLVAYFGKDVELAESSDMEGLRIPHFYTAFYVYKYATGISAAIALSEKILGGGKAERDAYRAFLSSGGSRYPIDSLRLAGVDMSTGEAPRAAVRRFGELLDQFEKLVLG